MIELVLETFLSGYRDGANNFFNDWFRLIAELMLNPIKENSSR